MTTPRYRRGEWANPPTLWVRILITFVLCESVIIVGLTFRILQLTVTQ